MMGILKPAVRIYTWKWVQLSVPALVTRAVNLQLQPDTLGSRLVGDIWVPLSSPASRKCAS